MVRYARPVVLLAIVFATATAVSVAASRTGRQGLVVHEWGTFTSVAGADGRSVNWTPLSFQQDLPCFVEHQNIQVKGRDIIGTLKLLASGAVPASPPVPAAFMLAKIRMETPVLYFYAEDAMNVSVKVSFQQGTMSEWYPRAMVPAPDLMRPLTTTVGSITWPAVSVRPGADPAYPQDGVKSHYYAARQVDASPLQVGEQHEKFLFYRGMADFQPSVAATIGEKGAVTATVPAGTRRFVLFENRHGRVAYRVADNVDQRVTLSRPVTGTLQTLRDDLEAMLMAEGLYAREAKAMVETWRDSWFEEGTRIFYLMPKAAVDDRLPLTISPAPADVARVFVGRLELITPEMKNDVERALANNDLDTLNSYGRFLDSIVAQIADRPSISKNFQQVAKAMSAVALSRPQTAVCQ